MAKTAEIPLILFAKAPIAGKVKTRLQTHCTAAQAAEVAKILLEQSIIKAKAAWPGPLHLSVSLDQNHSFLHAMRDRYRLEIGLQCAGDLGAKMHGAFEHYGYPAALMGADAPQVLERSLAKAHDYLAHGDKVLGPSDDGGYYLIGLARPEPSLFNNMPWGTDAVFAKTVQRSQSAFELVDPLNDVDEWADLISIAAQVPTLQDYLTTAGLIGR